MNDEIEIKICEGCGKEFKDPSQNHCISQFEGYDKEFHQHQENCYLLHLTEVLRPTRAKVRKNGVLIKNWGKQEDI